jgi:hypothetical protein
MIRGKRGVASALEVTAKMIRDCETEDDLRILYKHLETRREAACNEWRHQKTNEYLRQLMLGWGHGMRAVFDLLINQPRGDSSDKPSAADS